MEAKRRNKKISDPFDTDVNPEILPPDPDNQPDDVPGNPDPLEYPEERPG